MTNSQPSRSESTAFELLHPKIQKWVWERNWAALREIQEKTIRAVLGGSGDAVLSATTAAGKTEAAFLPICSVLTGNPGKSIRALYIGPLKALINDQFERLSLLCETLDIPVQRWHGDVPAGAKRKVVQQPSGILLITPESLEALFVLQGAKVRQVFNGLDFVVIDELHSFIGSERGRHLQSLLSRLELAICRQVRRLGLSATLGDMALAAEFLRPGKGPGVALIDSSNAGLIRMVIKGYCHLSSAEADAKGEEVQDRSEIADHLFKTLRGAHNLIFSNRREEVEVYADLLRGRCEVAAVPNEFWPHHGSLSKDLREDVEALVKSADRPATVVCTSTLEMGIDIGLVEGTAQIGPPPSVASMRQRLGRSGRRPGDPSVMRIYIEERGVDERTPPEDCLRTGLVQAVAMVRLLASGWCEPPVSGQLHLSTLVHQVLSVVAQQGGAMASEIWRTHCQAGPFRVVSPQMFAELLRGLADHDLIEQAPDGLLLLGGAGERIVNHYSFYAVFSTVAEYRLVHGTQTLGTLPIIDPVSETSFLIFAGRRWRIIAVDDERKIVTLEPSQGGRPPKFTGGMGWIHDRIRQEMRNVYMDADLPSFLDKPAKGLLSEGRDHFNRLNLGDSRLLQVGKDTLVFPWRGDRVLNTLTLMLSSEHLEVARDHVSLTVSRIEPDELSVRLTRLEAKGPPEALSLAKLAGNKLREKFDQYLTADLMCKEYATRAIDTEGAHRALGELLSASDRQIKGIQRP